MIIVKIRQYQKQKGKIKIIANPLLQSQMKKPRFKAKRRGTCPGSYALSDALRWRLIPDSGHLFPVHTLKFPIKVGWTIKPDLYHFHKWSDFTKLYRVNMGLLNKLQNNITKVFPWNIKLNKYKYKEVLKYFSKKKKKERKGVTRTIIPWRNVS